MKIKKRDQKKIITSFITILLILLYYFFTNYIIPAYSNENEETYIIPEGNLVVEFIDVGQADCIFISSNGHNALIDAGNEEDGQKLIDYFNKLGIKDFDFVLGTHPHEDHIGGLDDIIKNFNIHTVYLPNVTTTTKTFDNLLSAIENKNLNITIPKEDEIISLGEATFKILYTGTNPDDLNSDSIITKLSFGKYSFLFTGDTTSGVEEELLQKNINIDILKVAHHGSEYSTTNSFLASSTPEYAVISVGNDNSYNHPSKKTIDRIKKYTHNIYQTKDLGTIIFAIDKEELKISNIKTDTNGG